MTKSTEIFGIDISKDVFDVFSLEMGHHQFSNNEKGIALLLEPGKTFYEKKDEKISGDNYKFIINYVVNY